MARKKGEQKQVVKVKMYSMDGQPVVRAGKHIETELNDELKTCVDEAGNVMVDEEGNPKHYRPRNVSANPASAAKKLRAAVEFFNTAMNDAEKAKLTFDLEMDEESNRLTLGKIRIEQEF